MGEPIVNRPAGITTISGQSGQSRNRAPGARSDFLLCSYTSLTASTTASGSSNCTYSELCRVKICRAFEESSSQRALRLRDLMLVIQTLGIRFRHCGQMPDAMVARGQHADGPGTEGESMLPQVVFVPGHLFHF